MARHELHCGTVFRYGSNVIRNKENVLIKLHVKLYCHSWKNTVLLTYIYIYLTTYVSLAHTYFLRCLEYCVAITLNQINL